MTRRNDRPPRSQNTGSEQSEHRVILPPPDKPWLKPFQPGICPNPAGRPRTLERLARDLTNDGADCVALWLRMMKGEEPGTARASGLKWRAWASQRLAERGFGKPLTPIELSPGGAPAESSPEQQDIDAALQTLSSDDLRVFVRVLGAIREHRDARHAREAEAAQQVAASHAQCAEIRQR